MSVQLIPFILVVAAPLVLYGVYLLYDARRGRRNRAAALGEDGEGNPVDTKREANFKVWEADEPRFEGAPQPEPAFAPVADPRPQPVAQPSTPPPDAAPQQATPTLPGDAAPPAELEVGDEQAPGASEAPAAVPAQGPAVAEAAVPEASGKPEFPSMVAIDLQEDFHYMVRAAIPTGIKGAIIHELAAKLTRQGRHARHQLALGHDHETGRWEKPRADREYRHFIWAIPLCNREGSLNDEDMAQIVRIIQERMRQDGGMAEFPSHQDVTERIAAVNEFCHAYDVTLSVSLVASKADGGKPQRCGDIIQLARSEDLEEIDGRLVRHVNGEVLYTLDTPAGSDPLCRLPPDRPIAKVELRLDVPHVSNTTMAVEELFVVAHKIGRVLGFTLVSDGGEPILESDYVAVTQDVLESVQEMSAHGVQPGSRLARSLFT